MIWSILGLGLLVVSHWWVYRVGRSAGALEAAERVVDMARETNEIDESVGAMSAADVVTRLHEYRRD